MGKIVGRVGWGGNQEFRLDVCDTSKQRWGVGSGYASLEFQEELWIRDLSLGVFWTAFKTITVNEIT